MRAGPNQAGPAIKHGAISSELVQSQREKGNSALCDSERICAGVYRLHVCRGHIGDPELVAEQDDRRACSLPEAR